MRDERFSATIPDPGCPARGNGQKSGDDVDDESPFLVGLKTIEGNEGKIWDKYVTSLGPERREEDTQGETNLIDKWVEEEAREGRGEIEM